MKYFLYIGIVLFCLSCKTEEISPEAVWQGKEYYPISKASEWEYEVFEIKYKTLEIDTLEYKVKEILGESYDKDGSIEYNLYRYKSIEGSAYVLDSLWAVRVFNDKIIRIENNIWKQVLSFPISGSVEWDKNAHATSNWDKTYYTHLGEDYQEYTNTVRVAHDISRNVIDQDERYSIYAPNIGLVYQYCNVTSQQPNQPKVGSFVTQKLIRYEK